MSFSDLPGSSVSAWKLLFYNDNDFPGNCSSIKAGDELDTATGESKVSLVAEDDIADVAVELLTAPKLGGAECVIVGPELLSFDEVLFQRSRIQLLMKLPGC